jgi:hypothetical protein
MLFVDDHRRVHVQPEESSHRRWVVAVLSLSMLVSVIVGYVSVRVMWQRGVEPGIEKLRAELDAIQLPADIDIKVIARGIARSHGELRHLSKNPPVLQYLREFYEIYQVVAPLLSPTHQAMLICRDRPDICRKIIADVKKQTLQSVGLSQESSQ